MLRRLSVQPLTALLAAFFSSIFLVIPTPSVAQAFPAKVIRLIVVYPPGGTSDAVARPLADKLSTQLGQQVIVENKGGAGGAIGMDAMAKSPPDGYTLAFSAISPVTLLPHVGKVPYDPLKDIAPVASVMYSPVYMLATSAFTGKDFNEAIAQAKAKPGSLRLATSGIATLGHLMLEQIKLAAGVDIVHVPYKGGGQVITDAAGGQFELFTANPSPGVNSLLSQGRMRVLAVAAPQRLAAMPNIPTMLELGYPESNLTSQFGVFAPGRTPEAVLKRLNAEINKSLAAPDLSERLVKLDNVPSPSSVEQFAKTVRAEHDANARIVAKARIRVD
jgi:tripartite-type tricarboxylate transporter receptor subunit TctC